MERRTRAGGAWRGGATFVGCKVSTYQETNVPVRPPHALLGLFAACVVTF